MTYYLGVVLVDCCLSLDEWGLGIFIASFLLFVVRLYVTYKFKRDFSMNEGNEKVICVMETWLHLHYKKRPRMK
jgi:beta-lactamase regulating signal transducer with metallopeptidase domain